MNKQITDLNDAARSFKGSARKVEDGIHNVLEPEVKSARIEAYETKRIVNSLSRMVIILFSLSVVLNLATLIIVLNI